MIQGSWGVLVGFKFAIGGVYGFRFGLEVRGLGQNVQDVGLADVGIWGFRAKAMTTSKSAVFLAKAEGSRDGFGVRGCRGNPIGFRKVIGRFHASNCLVKRVLDCATLKTKRLRAV